MDVTIAMQSQHSGQQAKEEAKRVPPLWVITVDSPAELCFCCIPAAGWLEGNVGCCVVHDCEGTHPEVVAQPRDEPEL